VLLINIILPSIRGAPYQLSPYIGTSSEEDYDKKIISRNFGAQIAEQFAPLFYSTYFAISRHIFLSGNGEICRVFLLRCRGPPLPKSGSVPISEEQEVCLLRQVYIREMQLHFSVKFSMGPQLYAKCSISSANLLHIAKFFVRFKKLILIRSATSGLTVTLPNMDRKSGGECG